MKKLCLVLIIFLHSTLLGKVYDCFLFWKEFDLLKIRFEELYDVVDYFVLLEADKTFTNLPKPLYFAENAHLFDKYKDKIIHIVVDDLPFHEKNEVDFWKRQRYQRDALVRGLKNCGPDDIILISDLDEIPRSTTIKKIKEFFADKSAYTNRQNKTLQDLKACILNLEMPNFSCQLNRIAPTRWCSAKATLYWMFNHFGADEIRVLHQSHSDLPMIYDSGWHFNTMGDWKMAIDKWLCHDCNLANSPTLDEEALKRSYIEFLERHRPVPIDGGFPRYLRENVEYFRSVGLVADY